MKWDEVGSWLKDNAGTGAALIGSLLTGNIPGAIASGVALVSGATGTDDPVKALAAFQKDPATLLKLKELAMQNEVSVRNHIEQMVKLKLEDEQKAHETTQATIRSGDNASDRFVRWTRPGQSWISLFAAFTYVYITKDINIYVLGSFLTLPWAYAGLRQVGKGIDSITSMKTITKK